MPSSPRHPRLTLPPEPHDLVYNVLWPEFRVLTSHSSVYVFPFRLCSARMRCSNVAAILHIILRVRQPDYIIELDVVVVVVVVVVVAPPGLREGIATTGIRAPTRTVRASSPLLTVARTTVTTTRMFRNQPGPPSRFFLVRALIRCHHPFSLSSSSLPFVPSPFSSLHLLGSGPSRSGGTRSCRSSGSSSGSNY